MTQPLAVPIPGVDGGSEHVIVFAPDIDSLALWVDDVLVAGLSEGAAKQIDHIADGLADNTQTIGIALPAIDGDGHFMLAFNVPADQLAVYDRDGDTPLAAVTKAHSAIAHLSGRS
ncbi:hypothetical protein SAMN05192575_101931 [Nocardioides alpinus]|uniref:Uncharacterized protein n=1 Tax=Nocardioides alpinus TaxID=748909 RepID=A0A1I0WFC1_9ACTN|nr:hypothetical protein [Nocardioides alpinus]PKH37864.1 hypothetical protein CXG46_20980 [Nocardioides alpinus]SFA86860.1 hypothetical protein SAMN05192575_101931 [Nocardioides alpinus]